MDIRDVQLVGGPCGQHGPYTFYKAFKYSKNGVKKLVTLSEFFFVKMWRDSDLLCIGELQLLWTDKNSDQTLASLRLYFLPENTPEGRVDQGEDEVLAISEKVVIRLDDLITWITVTTEWSWGHLAKSEEEMKDVHVAADQLASPKRPAGNCFAMSDIIMDFSDVETDREKLEDPEIGARVIILSFPKYCRFRAMMKRLEDVENRYLKYKMVNALGGFYVKHRNTRILFCRDTFDYPELEGHELLCNHLAPKLKGRPRGKRKKRSISPGSESNESESSITNFNRATDRSNGVYSNSMAPATRRSTRCHENNENKHFMKVLSAFMKSRSLPMGRVPSLGYKELNLHEFYTRVQKLGGYDCVTTNRLWKSIFDDMTGHLNSTSAATIIRRHYERFLLAYEKFEKGEEYNPPAERRRLKNKKEGKDSEIEIESSDSSSSVDSQSNSRSSSSPPASVENKETSNSSPGKTSSLRSIRVKPERQKEKSLEKTEEQIKPESTPPDSTESTNNGAVNVQDIKMEVNEVEVKVEEKLESKEPIKEVDLEPEVITKEEVKPKTEADEVLPSVPEGTKTEGSMPVEPTTTAVAPVATIIIPEKNLSPIEGKENIPFKAEDVGAPRVASNGSYQDETIIIQDVKRMKLDILKEGGLEVTPVRSSPTGTKEFRPSVIQPPKPIMGPPTMNKFLPKRNPPLPQLPPSINITQIKVPPATQQKPESNQFLKSPTFPKVVQSRSIYSYSERTVYGNPKDVFQPTFMPHTPKTAPPVARPGGGDPVDLSLTSPQKPVIEIMPVPQSYSSNTAYNNVRANVTKNLYKTTQSSVSTASVLEGRKLGPNLEITLVGPKPSSSNSNMQRHTKTRTGGETYAQKIAKLKSEEARQSKYLPQSRPSIDPMTYKPNNIKPQKPQMSMLPPTMPPYLASRFPTPQETPNGINPYLLDSLYYQAALQNVYSNMNMPPVLPLPTAEQLKIYAEMMTGRMNMPYPPHPGDGHPSMSKKQ